MDPLPYNVNISSQSPAIQYSPSRTQLNENIESGWNVTYAHGTTRIPFGPLGLSGDSYLQTTLSGAQLSLDWVGTAAYIYGNATSSAAYTLRIDGTEMELPGFPKGNLLGLVTGLPYGSHQLNLSLSGSDIFAFHYATLTIGIGYQGSPFTVQNRSILAAAGEGPNSPAIQYSPSRTQLNENIESGWNVTYAHGTTRIPFGPLGLSGDSYLQTTLSGAQLSLDWVGTAAYIYGNATSSAAYTLRIDGTEMELPGFPKGNLLGLVTGLPYGSHQLNLSLSGSDIFAFHYATLTIGIGYQGSPFTVQNRSILAAAGEGPNVGFFNFQPTVDSWRDNDYSFHEGKFTAAVTLPGGSHTKPIPPPIGISLDNDTTRLVFNLTNASAFFMRGIIGSFQGLMLATLTPGLDGGASKRTPFNDASSVMDTDQILYWESGLDRDQTYTVDIGKSPDADEPPNFNQINFHTLDIIDGGPKAFNPTLGQPKDPTSSTSLAVNPTITPPATGSDRRKPSAGLVAGITVGVILTVTTITILILYWLRRCKRDRTEAAEIAEASKITAFVGRKSVPQRAAPQFKHRHEHEAAPPSSESNSNLPESSDPSVLTSPTPVSVQFATPVRETDAGPVEAATLPPEYDHSWAANTALSRRVLPIPQAVMIGPVPPSDKVERHEP
ncbi:hypothetical protein WG66_007270 [Moniliophthora roreri]|nr:hypothetical protein WG66_007270 [Moniliophthora roreri]